MIEDWKKKTLGEIYDLENGRIQTGPFGSQLHESDYKETGIPVIMPKDIINDNIDESNIAKISNEDANRLKRHLVQLNDIVFPRRGDIGKRVIIKKNQVGYFCGTGCIKLRGNGEILNPLFLFYFLKQNSIIDWIEKQAIGATMLNLNTKIFRSIPILYPPLPTQHKIANILSAYDDLIENNLKRIKLLEEKAKLTYEEWFVRLKFPGFENTPIEKETGFTEGWEKLPLSELVEMMQYGYTASASQEEVGPKFLRITDIVPDNIQWDNVPYCPIKEELISKYFLNEGDIVVARTGATVGYAKRINKKHPNAVFASYLIRIVMNSKLDDIVAGKFIESVHFKNWVQNMAGGAAQPNANAPILKKIKMIVPPQFIQKRYRNIVEKLEDAKENLLIQNRLLKEARDILLPRLMTGMIEVDDLNLSSNKDYLMAAEPKIKYGNK